KADVSAQADAGAEFSFEDTKMRSVAPGHILDALNASVKPAAFGSELNEGLVHIGYEYLYSSKIKIESGTGTAAKAAAGVQAASVVDIAANLHRDSTGKEQRTYQGENPVAFAFAAARLTHDGKAFALDYDAPAGSGIGPGVQAERKVVRTGQIFDFTE